MTTRCSHSSRRRRSTDALGQGRDATLMIELGISLDWLPSPLVADILTGCAIQISDGFFPVVIWDPTLSLWIATTLGMKPDYDCSAALAQRVKDAYTEIRVDPHWFGRNKRIWYIRQSGPKQHSFIVVEASDGTSRPAFDPRALSQSAQGAESCYRRRCGSK